MYFTIFNELTLLIEHINRINDINGHFDFHIYDIVF